MAARLFKQFMYSANHYPVFIEGSFTVGASGVVAGSSGLLITPTTAIIGTGVAGVYKGGTGQYTIQLSDNYNRFIDFQAIPISPTVSSTGVTVDGSFTVGKPYQVVWPSTSTNWQSIGLPAGIVAQYGTPFVATSGASKGPFGSSGATAFGTGTAIQVGQTGIGSIELLNNPNTVLGTSLAGLGAVLNIQTLNYVSASSANLPANPTSGTVIRFNITMRNSSVLGTNELPATAILSGNV